MQHTEDVSLEREAEVAKIMESVMDLAQVMKDLSVLVVDQGSVLDRIDYNCEQVAVAVEEGHKELVHAETTQKKNRLLVVILCLFVAVVLMTIVVVIQKSS